MAIRVDDRLRIHQRGLGDLGREAGHCPDPYPARQAAEECLYRALQPHRHFDTIAEAQRIAIDWLWTYDNERPNTSIGGITPVQKLKMAA